MEKRLRSSLKSSPRDFISLASELPFKSSKSTLKTLIYSTIAPNSGILASLSQSLQESISASILSFQNLLENPSSLPDPAKTPPTKRLRRSSRKSNSGSELPEKDGESDFEDKKRRVLEKLRVLTHIAHLCFSHPKKVFLPSDLLPAVQALHDNLVLFESDSALMSEIASLCEDWWKEGLSGREILISRSLPYLLSRSLTLKKKVDVHRVYSLREAFALFDFEDESIEDLKLLLIRCVIAPLYLKTEDGRRFVAYMFGLGLQLLKEALAMIKAQIPFGRKSLLEAYGDILFRAWKATGGSLRDEIENVFLQGLIERTVHASSGAFGASIRRVLGAFTSQRTIDGVEKLLFRLAEPVLFRSLQVANSNVRLNALHLLLDLFPLEDPDATKEVKDALLDKQFFLLERLLMDDCPDVRVVAVEGCCRILNLFWEVIHSSTITKIITKIFDDMSHDVSNEVRLSTLSGIMYLMGNPQSHELLKVLVPRLGHLMLDNVLSVRVAVVDLLLLIRDIRSFQFNKVVGLDVLFSTLANDQPQVAQKITRLLMPSYFPSRVNIDEACNRCVALIKRSPMAGSRFCEFAVLEGASLGSLVELVRRLICMVLSPDKLDADQIEGFLIAAAHLCNSLAGEPCYRTSLKELFGSKNIKCLYTAASTNRAQSSVLHILSTTSPENVAALFEECMNLVTNCGGLPDNVERQAEVRSALKLLLSNDGFNDMFDALIGLLQKTAYGCHIKFGIEIPKQSAFSSKRKKVGSSVKISAKRKNASGRKPSEFEEDYLVAVGIAWQIKDLLVSEDTQKFILGSPALEFLLRVLKAISEVSILQCLHYDYMDTYPVLAYTALALHMMFQNVGISSSCPRKNEMTDSSRSTTEENVLAQTVDHLLYCTTKLFEAGDCAERCNLPSDSNKKMAKTRGQKQRDTETDTSNCNCDGPVCTKTKGLLKKVKMLTAVLKFIVDSMIMGFVSHLHGRCLKFTSAYVRHIISVLGQEMSNELHLDEDSSKEILVCLKSSFSYASKLLNLVLRAANETSPPLPEAFDLANDLLEQIASIELNMGSVYATRLVAAAKPWLPDLILALASRCMLKETEAETIYSTLSDHIKLHFPSWLLVLAKTELCQTSEEMEDEDPEPDKFPAFGKLMGMMISLLKANSNVLDAIGVIFLAGSLVGLERKDYAMVLGLLQFVSVKLIGHDDREWRELDLMLSSVPSIYSQIERDIEEQSHDEEKQKLLSAKALLEPVWMYHLYETQRFSIIEE
ncbi:hypothetical protein HS088_TW14G00358 [Tripterygium wilfordii]|uniref:Condensin-2 complex subunit G2 n=1 Tax=Tripterygium wilfordii TaxID=458696 RepID=A0A7J7CQ42_TRIWF|nr:uncharacterized protein LOC120014288 [Tripterygium wilfordii]KAF5736222.1 hypothetical protein HS088_TW14G00358 [Tripterygium wilfordii]